jgi:transglutaminase-like putative cysteine protease
MKKLILSVLLILSAVFAGAQSGLTRNWIAPATLSAAAAQSGAEYADADILLVDDIMRVRYESDGTYSYVSDSAFKIFTEKGRQDKSTISIGYSTSYGSSRFVQAEVVKPDGRVIPVDIAAQSREAIDQGQMNANIYDPHQKTIKLTIPHLEIGDVLHYTVSGEVTKTVVPGAWSDLYTFEDTFPIRHSVYEIDAPADRPLRSIALKDEIPGTVTFHKEETDGRIHYRWEARNVPRMFEEPGMPAAYTVSQRVLASTIPDWKSLSKWYWELSKPHLENSNSNMVAKVEELTAGIADRQEKIEAIFRFVSQDVRYMGITLENEAPGYEPHDVSLTFDNRYGVCRDKAALLVSLLRIAGFDAYPVLIYVGPKKDPEVPQPWFNHAITAVRNKDGSWLLMDSTNENTRDLLPAYLSNRSYLIATPDGETLQTSPVVPPEQNMLDIRIDAALDSKERISGTAVMKFGGINDTAYRGRLAGLKPEEREPYFEERLKQAFGSARLLRLDITPAEVRDTTVPLSVALRFEVENAVADGSDKAVLQIPTLLNQFGLFGRLIGNGIGLDQRRYPLQTQVTCGIRETTHLDLNGSGLQPTGIPAYKTIDNPELYIHRDVTAAHNVLTGHATVLLRTVEFSPEQYLTLKQNLKISERNARKRVILSRSEFPPGADLAVLDEKVVYTVDDATHWKEERTLRRKVLTYAGKQEAADFKLAYNPAVQQTVLDSATVTSPNGSVLSIDPEKEVHLMDAGWAGEAPRYPSGKILVANLPGVEIGSVIETRVTSVFSGIPFFSTVEFFAGFDPLVEKTVQVKAPPSMQFEFISTDPSLIHRRTFQEAAHTVYEWTAEKRPMIKKEEHLPPEWLIAPALFVSNGDLKTYAADVRNALLKAADKNRTISEKARELTDGLETRLEKITALRDFTDRTVREAGPGFSGLPLSAVTPADRTLAEGYGNTADRAVLLYALLDAAGLNPRFVLTSGLPCVEAADSPAIAAFQRLFFDTVLVAVDDDSDQTLYLGDSGQYARPGTLAHAGRPSIDLKSGNLEFPQTDLSNSIETKYTIGLFENGDATLTKHVAFTGTEFEDFHRQFAQFTPEERRRAYQNLLSRISQAAAPDGDLKTSFSSPGTLEFSANVPAFSVRDKDHLYFTLPEGLDNLLGLETSERDNPFYIGNHVDRVFQYEITLPTGWKTAVVPESFRIDLPAQAGFVEVDSTVTNGCLSVIQQAHLNPALIPPEEYDRLLLLNDKLTGPDAGTVLLYRP